MYKEKIINIQTGEETIREYTKEEIAKVNEDIEKHKKIFDEMAKREETRKSALAKLAALGLTEEEIAAL